jgi:hypothetical protein
MTIRKRRGALDGVLMAGLARVYERERRALQARHRERDATWSLKETLHLTRGRWQARSLMVSMPAFTADDATIRKNERLPAQTRACGLEKCMSLQHEGAQITHSKPKKENTSVVRQLRSKNVLLWNPDYGYQDLISSSLQHRHIIINLANSGTLFLLPRTSKSTRHERRVHGMQDE